MRRSVPYVTCARCEVVSSTSSQLQLACEAQTKIKKKRRMRRTREKKKALQESHYATFPPVNLFIQ